MNRADASLPAVVFVSYFYPPMTAVGGLRIQGFAERIFATTEGKVRAVVVTVGDDFVWSQENGVAVLRCPDWRFRIPRKWHVSGANHHVPIVVSPRSIASRLKSRIRRIANELLIPDDQMLWFLHWRRVANMLRAECDGGLLAVVSSSPPATGHAIGRKIAKALNAPWVADYRDSWVMNPHWTRSRVRVGIDRWLEKRLLADAAVITCAAPVLLKEFGLRNPYLLLTGFAENHVLAEKSPVDMSQFTLLHAGQLYDGRRDPSAAIAAARLLSDANQLPPGRICSVFVGDDSAFASRVAHDMSADGYCMSLPSCDAETARQMMRAAGALISISWKSPHEDGALPGKIFEYIVAGRPIVALGGSRIAVSQLLEDVGVGRYAETPEEIVEFLQPHVRHWLEGSAVSVIPRDCGLSKQDMTRTLLEIISTVSPRVTT